MSIKKFLNDLGDYYSLVPRIVPTKETIVFRFTNQCDLPNSDHLLYAQICPIMRFDRSNPATTYKLAWTENSAEFACSFDREQSYLVRILNESNAPSGIDFFIYALEEDLFRLRPHKGDFHMHTCHSDGLETPPLRLAIARQRGLDFVAITDHNNYSGSVSARKALSKCPNRMVSLLGEEVHAGPKEHGVATSPVHILSLEAEYALAPFKKFYDKSSQSDLASRLNSNFEALSEDNHWLKELGREKALGIIQKTAERREAYARVIESDPGAEGIDSTEYAFTRDVFDEIRDAGGVSVLCHPLWRPIHDNMGNFRLDAPFSLIERLVSEKPFDAFEVVSGAPKYDSGTNIMQEKILQEAELDKPVPIIGITDTHKNVGSGDILGCNYTIVFSESFDPGSICKALTQGNTVAVEDYNEEDARIHGPLRLSLYASFLISEYFNRRQNQVNAEGLLMEWYLRERTPDYASMLEKLCELNEERDSRWWWERRERM